VADLQTAIEAAAADLVAAGTETGLQVAVRRRRTEMAAVAFTGMDEVMGFPSRWAFGYAPGRPGGVPGRDGSSFGMIGSNGSAAYADIDSGLAVAIMRNGPPAGLAAVTRIDQLIADHEEDHP
jgi:Beta-lactamase